MGKIKKERKYEFLDFFKHWKYDSAVSFEALMQSGFPCFLYASSDMYVEFELSKENKYYNNYATITINSRNSFALFFTPVFHNLLLVFACLGFFVISW